MTDRQPADEAFHSCLVDPDLSVAGVPVYTLATLCFEHLCLRARLVLDSFYSNSATRQIRNSGRKRFSAPKTTLSPSAKTIFLATILPQKSNPFSLHESPIYRKLLPHPHHYIYEPRCCKKTMRI